MPRTLRILCLALLAVLASAVPAQAGSALPGDKANFVVATGNLTAGARTNWLRLGTYAFDSANGTVSARMHLWEHARPQARVGTGTVPGDSCSTTSLSTSATVVRACEIQTAGGFTADPKDLRTGTFEMRTETVGGVAKPVLWISWNTTTAWTEKWVVETSPGLARLSFLYSTKATTGYGYGSNAALSTRRAMSSVQAHPDPLTLQGQTWTHDQVSSAGGVFQHTSFRTCDRTSWCLTMLQPTSARACQATGGCPTYGGGTTANVSSLQYYLQKLSSTDRRDTLWHWCTCLAMEQNRTCYTGNSHVKPMLQIIDDAGTFRGWVGVEASFYPYSGTDPRANDMLGVFRIADWV
ncbi:hypothetical protein [Streptomyces sp. NRRL S-118]|uniref:hypothetical protein n=1 Tax=Streptomyces sp. NRRL S-118 TaxID=1463881 RepID=UPI00131D5D3E|nr:hypothetical protein [Streptomyces sp. NRRL S-118]